MNFGNILSKWCLGGEGVDKSKNFDQFYDQEILVSFVYMDGMVWYDSGSDE